MADGARPRFESLDVVRGVAALAVVISHWNLFYWPPGADKIDLSTVALPFGRVTWFFCTYGGFFAVDIFFCLSGFIFFYLYRTAIEGGQVGARNFAVLRFSRLYPLHFATLLIAAALLTIYKNRYGVVFGRAPIDVPHFLSQVAFVSNWWPGSPNTFNRPIWSVSIEVLLYIVFFIAAAARVLRVETAAVASLAGFLLLAVDDDLGRGVAEFYMGGLAYYLATAISNRKVPRSLIATLALVAIVAFVILKGTGSRGYVGWFLMVLAFPGMIVFLVVYESYIERWIHPPRWLGNISYSTYLLHAPLMFLIILIGWSIYAPSRMFMIGFMAVLIGLSLLSFHRFEYPMQQWIRRKMLTR